MSASESQADQTNKGQPGLRIRIRVPPRKRLSDGIRIMSTGVPEDTEILSAKKTPEQTDNYTQSKTFTATKVKVEEVSSNPSGVPEDTKNLSAKKVPERTDNNTQGTTFTATKVKVEEASRILPGEGLCKEANSKNLSKTLSGDTLTEKVTPSKNMTITTGVQAEEESSYHVRKGLCEEGNKNILNKGLPPEKSSNATNVKVKEASRILLGEGLCKEANSNNLSKTLSGDPLPEKVTMSRNMTITTGVQGEEESSHHVGKGLCEEGNKNILNMGLPTEKSSNTPIKESCVGDTDKTLRKGVPEEATINSPSNNLATSAVKYEEADGNSLGNSLAEKARNNITAGKLSADAKDKALSRRAVIPANYKTSSKKLRTSVVYSTATGQNTSQMKPSNSVCQAMEQSTSDAKLEVIIEYKEFEQKVRRTVYLDNLSPLVTEAVIKMALNQFGSVRKVNFLVNYTVPYDIPGSALVEMDTEKDAESVVNMLHEFPFMVSGMPRPVRGKLATAEMFNDRPRRSGNKLEFYWVGRNDPDYENARKFKLISKGHEVENLVLIKHQLEEEKLLAKQQQDTLSCNYRKLEAVDSVILSGRVNRLSNIYNISLDGVF